MNIRFRKTIGVEMSACGKTKRAEHVSMLRRAEHEMRRWRRTLRPKQRAKLDMQASSWGRNGGSIVAPKRPPTKSARRYEKLRRERKARFRAEQADYEARVAAPWKIVRRDRD